ncbi:gp59 [Bacillus phage W.Ph.]|uniref:Gp59 n=1 Tax=Bacillus phage W.Ph. TaxID=764595 RepID=G9B1G0_9CAUD|nr:gp59 [Bacillus phage W.Ph.]ADH03205.1 gp59 [Bacillus phage W.Ph.]
MTKNQKALTKAELTTVVKTLEEKVDSLQPKTAEVEPMKVYLDYIATGEVQSDEQKMFIPVFANKAATIADATLLARFSLTQVIGELEEQLMRTMRTVHVLEEVAIKLGATQEMFDDAAKAHDDKVAKLTKEQAEKIVEQQTKEVTEG